PADLPLIVDDGFMLSEVLQTSDVPNLALYDSKGGLVISRLKDRQQMAVTAEGNLRGDEVVRRPASTGQFPTIQQQFVYYPATELFDRCAPAFTAKKFNSRETYTFSGRSASGRPTLLLFWSSTCKHCQVEVPNLVAWLAKHPG